MTDLRAEARAVIAELDRALACVDGSQFDQVAAALAGSRRVFVLGVGREGLAARALAMRLMHLGLVVHWGWDDTTPNVTADDVFVLVSGSGTIGHLDYVFEQVRQTGAQTIVVTGVTEAATPRAADIMLGVPVTVYRGTGDLEPSIQPMGSLFEQATLLLFDLLVLDLARRRGLSLDQLAHRHRNFE